MRVALALGGLAILLAGCDGAPPAPPGDAYAPCGTGPGAAVVGTGTTRFVPLPAAGGELEIVRGAQGGIHVLVGFRPSGMDLRARVVYALRDPAGGADLAEPVERVLDPGGYTLDGDRYVRLNDLVVLDNMVPRVEDFVGRTATLGADIVSTDGTHACPSAPVTLVDRI